MKEDRSAKDDSIVVTSFEERNPYLMQHHKKIVQFSMKIPTHRNLLGNSRGHRGNIGQLLQGFGCLA